MHTSLHVEASVAQELAAALNVVAFAALDRTGWIRVTGSDRVRWLNGMLTNSIQELAQGKGCYNFALNSQGRIQGDMNVFAPADDPDALLIETDRGQVAALMAHLDHFIIMDDVELSDATSELFGLLLVGPGAVPALQQLGLPYPDKPLTTGTGVRNSGRVLSIHAYSPLVPRFEIWAERATIEGLIKELATDVLPLSGEALEYIRVLEGTPHYGVDIRDTGKAHDLPQETAPLDTQSRALHFSKGCYLGQEIVERIRSRGSVHRAFSGFELTGSLPAAGIPLHAGGRVAGELTSVAEIPLQGRTVRVALGYVRREAMQRGLVLEYAGGTAIPVPLPYRVAADAVQTDTRV